MCIFSQKDKKQEGLNKQTQETRFLFKCYCSNKLSVLSRVFVVALLLKLLYRVGFLCVESLSAFFKWMVGFPRGCLDQSVLPKWNSLNIKSVFCCSSHCVWVKFDFTRSDSVICNVFQWFPVFIYIFMFSPSHSSVWTSLSSSPTTASIPTRSSPPASLRICVPPCSTK